ncbi:MAG TPA: rod shape-determining protein MreD [Thiobacillaceae bacterium]|nr:rod shape-determining protein MreD [Thiobacillaceae bacterium]HNU63799.1 rod shape-determining protein MreD [Thiobacillaceae bacterium]
MSQRPTRHEKAFLRKGAEMAVPATRARVWSLLGVGLALNLSPWADDLRWLVPDFALMSLLYWGIHAPRWAGLGTACALGLVVDVARGLHLGLNALAYCTAAFVVLMLQRRLENFDVSRQGLQLAPLLLGKEALVLVLGLMFAHGEVDWRWLASGAMAALLWVPMAWLLDRLTGRPIATPGE